MCFKLAENQIIELPVDDNPLLTAAAHICERCADKLPDLSAASVLVPAMQVAAPLQRALYMQAEKAGHSALLQPQVMSFQDFAALHASPSTKQVLSEQERLLILVNELRHHQTLFGNGSPWLLAENLLQLFDELIMHQVKLPSSTDDFVQQLSLAYQVPIENQALQREARLVLTLWQAWQEHLNNESVLDSTQHRLQQFSSSLNNIKPDQLIFVLGALDISSIEQQWLQKLAQKSQFYLFRHPASNNDDGLPLLGLNFPLQQTDSKRHEFLTSCYNWQEKPLVQRIQEFKSQQPESPVANNLAILGVDQLEQQAQTVALFIRSTLAEHSQHIGIICEDRLLARRIRALLERSDIFLRDAVGWALSTTRAAAVIESWLECIELDFPHHAFLDILKSPLYIDATDDNKLKLIYRLEHDIVLNENIGSGLSRYQKAIELRSHRLEPWSLDTQTALTDMLLEFGQLAEPLKDFLDGDFDAADGLAKLIASLKKLNQNSFFETDPAADKILQTLTSLQLAAQHQPIKTSWTELRNWINREFETEYFQIETPTQQAIVLLNLEQSYLQHFDSVIIAAADDQHLPGNSKPLPFFNQSVRVALGLPNLGKQRRIRETLFRSLIECSNYTLLLWQQERDGEPISASPWVQALSLFHEQAYGSSLEPKLLKQWVHNTELIPGISDPNITPEPAQQPEIAIGETSLPASISVSAHQRLIDCPYRFYVHDVLRLKPLDEIREALQKSDYGNLVHRCMEAFHSGVATLPGPMKKAINQETRSHAIKLLKKIAHQVFAEDIEDNFQHRGWLQRWLDFIPQYIDWQIKHAVQWQITAGEQFSEKQLNQDISLRGRIDRIEQSDTGINLIDYKTGSPPLLAEIESGEEVQLVSYSLIIDHVTSVQYLGIDGRKGVYDKSVVADEDLAVLQQAVKKRLINVIQRIRSNEPLPANGDEIVCSYCEAAGICRRAAWKSLN